jgi:3-dehydroquinate dehydratase-2
MKIIVINGPNLNMLGKRDKNHYGDLSLISIKEILQREFPDIEFEFFQSNHEGEIIEKIQNADKEVKGLLINPGGYAHTSVAIRDALAECSLPKIEVHLSHLANREKFRQKLITASACSGYISGFKEKSYSAGVFLLKKLINEAGR